MKRKVIKQGHNTLTVTLPAKWVESRSIKAGDEIDIEEKDGCLLMGAEGNSRPERINLDVTNLDRTTILILVQGLYRYGYDAIEVTSREHIVSHHRVEKKVSLSELIYSIVNRLIGAEVIGASAGRFMIKRIASESIDDFPVILRRIFLLLNDMMDSFIAGISEQDRETIRTIEFQHTNIKKFLNYSLRLLNEHGYGGARKTAFYFTIISLISKIEDILKNNARYIITNELKLKSKDTLKLLKNIRSSIRQYYELFYDYSLDKIAKLNKDRDIFRAELFDLSRNLSKEENLIMGGLSQIIELILDMSEIRMALES